MDVHHVNPVCEGVLHGVAELDHVDDLGEKGRKEVWRVEATDDAGTVISTGTFTTRVVSKAYFDSLGKDAPAAR
jgi:1,4-dihydroxy-2-naphthoyl-CoA hydrolase